MKKRKIVIASVLKPVDDTRMFEKIAVSLAETGEWSVYIIGFPSLSPRVHAGIEFIPSRRFGRLSWSRFMAPVGVLGKINAIDPDVLIVTTHELLLAAVCRKVFRKTRIVYDVQENYFRNILFTRAFPPILRHMIAMWVRLKETLLAPWVDHFFLAERGYAGEMRFPLKRFTILENKARLPPGFTREPVNGSLRLLFSGTLDATTGVFDAIELAAELHKLDEAVSLHLIGFCARGGVLSKIKGRIASLPFVSITGGNELQPHSEILDAIKEAHFGIVSYPPSPHVVHSIPTKVFEYMACRLPILVRWDSPGAEMIRSSGAGTSFDPAGLQAQELITHMRSASFYLATPQGVTWDAESMEVRKVVAALMSGTP